MELYPIYLYLACCYCITRTDKYDDKKVSYSPILCYIKDDYWPTRPNTFALPKALGSEDDISFVATMTEGAQNFKISLVSGKENPDYNNTCYQLVVKMPRINDKENYVLSRIVLNGKEEIVHGKDHDIKATAYFSDANIKVTFIFEIRDNHIVLITHLGENNFYAEVKIKHKMKDLRFLTFDGDIKEVKNLKFTFAESIK